MSKLSTPKNAPPRKNPCSSRGDKTRRAGVHSTISRIPHTLLYLFLIFIYKYISIYLIFKDETVCPPPCGHSWTTWDNLGQAISRCLSVVRQHEKCCLRPRCLNLSQRERENGCPKIFGTLGTKLSRQAQEISVPRLTGQAFYLVLGEKERRLVPDKCTSAVWWPRKATFF